MFSYAASQRLPCAIETCGKRFTCTQCVGTWNHTVLLSYNCVDKRFIEQFHWTRSVLLLSLLYFDLLQVDSPSATGLFPSNKGSIIKFLEQVRRWHVFLCFLFPSNERKRHQFHEFQEWGRTTRGERGKFDYSARARALLLTYFTLNFFIGAFLRHRLWQTAPWSSVCTCLSVCNLRYLLSIRSSHFLTMLVWALTQPGFSVISSQLP